MSGAPSLRPVTGSPAEVERLVADWLAAAAADPPALTVRTSGSTGEPKDVALSRRAVVASARATLRRIGGPGQWVLALPPHYVAGLQVIVRSALAGTSPVLLADHGGLPTAVAALTSARRYVALVPTQLHRLLADAADIATLVELDAVLLGGAAAPAQLLSRARECGVRVVSTYGMSETCGGCVYDGVPLDGVRARVGDDQRIELGGPMLFEGYVDQPALTAQVLRDGWYRTDDLGRIDDDGRLDVLGRADEVVVSGGVNVPLRVVERRLLSHPAIRHAAVVGVPDDEWGTRVLAVLVVQPDAEPPAAADVRDFVSAVHPREWAPREVRVTDALPLLESGKVDRQALQHYLARQHG